MTVLAGARVVTPEGILDPGWVRVEGARIAAVGHGRSPTSGTDLGGAWLLPGYVDLHVHGGDGGAVEVSADGLARSVAFHRRHGTTRTLASIVTGQIDAMAAAAGWVADAVGAGPTPTGHVVGVHFEGPFLAAARCGAQDPAAIIDPDPAVMARLLAAGRGTVRMVTIAPERPGALDLIAQVKTAGAAPAIGHTDAHYADAVSGFAAGAAILTHTFNGMRGLHHRDPGTVGAARDSGVACEAINDGIHLHDAVVRMLAQLAGDRLCFVTDAMAAAGVGDGDYDLGARKVVVRGGKATLAGTDSIAGSTLTMERAVARAVTEVGLTIEAASHAASAAPAAVIGGTGRFGAIAAGLDADLVVLDDTLAVQNVMAQGAWSDR
ncbi:MAG: N-acetylglucosamine-6-phosphate deacetylase [Mycobacteriales bacterium]